MVRVVRGVHLPAGTGRREGDTLSRCLCWSASEHHLPVVAARSVWPGRLLGRGHGGGHWCRGSARTAPQCSHTAGRGEGVRV